jgi:hypothetical protein
MSVAVALIHPSGGVVASDGRVFNSVNLVNGAPENPATIHTENFDKTFSALHGQVIGTFTGLMMFSGKSTGEHVQEIIAQAPAAFTEIKDLAEHVCNQLCARLVAVNPAELNLQNLRLCVCFVARRTLIKKNYQIYSSEFSFTGNVVEFALSAPIEAFGGRLSWFISGDDGSRPVIGIMLKNAPQSCTGRNNLLALARRAITDGIASATIYKYGVEKSCGGSTSTRHLVT